MPWYHFAACFLGGVFLANFVPHFVAGVSGRRLQTPFARPPFRGLSSPAVNVLWGLFNLGVAYVLLVRVANFELRRTLHVAVALTGFALASIGLAQKLGRLRTGDV